MSHASRPLIQRPAAIVNPFLDPWCPKSHIWNHFCVSAALKSKGPTTSGDTPATRMISTPPLETLELTCLYGDITME